MVQQHECSVFRFPKEYWLVSLAGAFWPSIQIIPTDAEKSE
jgi:hypothetical protein